VHLILGAGCAGLSLACALLDAGVGERIVLVDRRTGFDHDRTWCFWDTGAGLPFAGLATHAWPTWQLVGRDGRVVQQRSRRHPYLHLPADRFYRAALGRLEAAPNVELRLGEAVAEVDAGRDGVRVRTARGDLEGAIAYDAMGGGGPLQRGRPPGAVELRQRFLGLEVEVERPVFDPARATLMDFRAGRRDDDGLRFMYVLPFSPTRALVEDTSLGGRARSPHERRAAIAAHLRELWGAGAVEVLREERGTLPMSTGPMPAVLGPRVLAVGAAAGAVRPSSGYAFVRLQRHVAAVARAVAAGTPPPARVGRSRHARLDALFLRALSGDPAGFDRHLLALARGVDAGTFARFMTDASSLRDEASVVAALTRPGFLRAMAFPGAPRPAPRRAPTPVASVLAPVPVPRRPAAT
jgi:lycopene beta-cyclase